MLRSFKKSIAACFASKKNEKAPVAILVWSHNDNDSAYSMCREKCQYSCLRSKAYVKASQEYNFQYSCGAVGRVWATEQNEIINTYDTGLHEFWRRDVARLYGFKTIILTFLDNMVIETAIGEHVNMVDLSTLNTPPTI